MEIECDLTKGPRDATLGDSYWWHTLVHLTWICNKDPASEVQIVDLTIAYCFKESLSTDLQYCMYDMYAFPSGPMDIFQLQVCFWKGNHWSHEAAQQAPPTELQGLLCFFHQALTSTKREQSVIKNPIFAEHVRQVNCNCPNCRIKIQVLQRVVPIAFPSFGNQLLGVDPTGWVLMLQKSWE